MTLDYVGFGMLTPVAIMTVDRLPPRNTGALVKEIREFIFDDAAIVAGCLSQWGVKAGMIGTAVGDDPRGHALADLMKRLGVEGEVRFTDAYATPLEVDISDRHGARTYFWQRTPEMLATLDTADLSLIHGARLLYVDWYDGEQHITRAMAEARRLGIPVFLNLEFGHKDTALLQRYAQYTTICQAVTDPAQLGKNRSLLSTARRILNSGIEIVLITMAAEGCLVAQGEHVVRIFAPRVKVVDACGAGATFSAGFIYGYLHGWDLERSARFATAAASLKVTRAGLEMFPISEIETLAKRLRVEHLSFRDNRFHRLKKIIKTPQNLIAQHGQNLVRQAAETLKPLAPNRHKSDPQPK